jgi:predicted GIY-YIG superfamily endonuclease
MQLTVYIQVNATLEQRYNQHQSEYRNSAFKRKTELITDNGRLCFDFIPTI